MAGLASINIKFSADLKEFSTKMQTANRSIKKMGKQMTNVGKNLSVGVTAPFVALGAIMLNTWDKQEQAIAQVNAGLDSTGKAVGYTSEQLQKMASDLQDNSLFGDEEILQNATAQLLTFTNIAGEQFKRTQQAAIDLSTRLGGDLKSASIQLGKALNDPVANLSALSRSGIQFSTDQKAMINSLVKTNRLADAQTIILDELSKQYGGAGAAAAKAGLGGFKQLKNSIGDVGEEFGAIIAEAILPFVAKIKGVVNSFKNLSKESKKQIVLFGSIAAAVGPVLVGLGFMMTTVVPGLITSFGYLRAALLLAQGGFLKLTAIMAANPFGALAVALAAVASYFLFFNKSIDETVAKQSLLSKVNETAAKSIANEKAKLAELLFIAQNENIQKSARIKAVKELNNLSPKYLGNLTLETINTDAARVAVEKYNLELIKTAKVKAAQQKLQELQSKIIDIELAKEEASVSFAKDKLKLKNDINLSADQQNKLLSVTNQNQELGNKFSETELKTLKDQEAQILKIIAANKENNVVVKKKATTAGGPTKQVAIGGGLKSVGISSGLNEEAVAIDTTLNSLKEKFSAFQSFSGEFTSAIGASFSAMGSQLASVFATGNTIVDAFVGSIINSLTELAAAFVQQLVMEKVFSTGKKAIDAGKASSNAIVIASSAAAAMGPVGVFALPGLIASQLAVVGGAFAGIAAFENGGIVGGTSFSGDKLFARINSGEMVLNQKQQRNAAALMGGGASSGSANFTLMPSIKYEGTGFRIMLNRVDKSLARRK